MSNEVLDIEVNLPEASEKKTEKFTIVYVDDEEHNLRVFKSLFRRFYNVVLFSNPVDALEYLKTEEAAILISDQQMPQMKGTELIEEISQEKDLITIILTGYSDIEVIKDAINRCGIYRFITKPYDFEELKADFTNALETIKLRREKDDLLGQIQEQNRNLEIKVTERSEELAVTNKRLIESLKYAERIQNSILTDKKLLKQAFDDVLILYKPLDIVSGDFYLFKQVENKYIIASFDCTGHGVPGAILSMLGSSTLNSLFANHILKPSELLIALNNKIYEILNDGGETNDGMEGSIFLYNPDSNKIIYSGARSEMILFKGDKMERIKGNRLSLGEKYLSEDEVIEQVNIDANEVSSCYLFSDGYKDQLNESRTEKFNSKRFNALLSEIHNQDFDQQKTSLEMEYAKWKGSTDQVDDIMILGFKIPTR